MARHKFRAGDLVKYNGKHTVTCSISGIEKAVVMRDENEHGFIRIKVLEHRDKEHIGEEFPIRSFYFEKIDETIVIYRKGANKVVALDRVTGKQAEATCSPVDRFDFHFGAELAFKRLLNKEETRTEETYYSGTIQLLDKYMSHISGKRVDLIDIKDGKFELDNGTFPLEPTKPLKDFEEVKEYFLNKFAVKPIRVMEIEKGYGFVEKGDYVRLSQSTNIVPVSIEPNTVYRVLDVSLFSLDIREVHTDRVIKVSRAFIECTILKNYKENAKFKPRLERGYGILGDTTPLKDVIGRTLRAGDTVDLYDGYHYLRGERPIVKTNLKAFVHGIACDCEADGTITGGWKIILKRKYECISDGEVVNSVKYIKGER